jgi:hypothetical protein
MFLSTMRLISCAATQLINEKSGFQAANILKSATVLSIIEFKLVLK